MALRCLACHLGRSQRAGVQSFAAPGLASLRGFASDASEELVSVSETLHIPALTEVTHRH